MKIDQKRAKLQNLLKSVKKETGNTKKTTISKSFPSSSLPITSSKSNLDANENIPRPSQNIILQNKKKNGKDKNAQMILKLKEGKFRYLNEFLYSKPSEISFSEFSKDPALFEEYHEGFRSQVQKWPINPLSIIQDLISIRLSTPSTSTLKSNTSPPPDTTIANLKGKSPLSRSSNPVVVADMGCGEANLAKNLLAKHKNVNVHSFDMVQYNPMITIANIKNVPVRAQSVDIAVFCLSLMGTDYVDFLKESNRILKINGELLIAEVTSRISSLDKFKETLEKCGFDVGKMDEANELFVILQCVKVKNVKSTERISDALELKVCKYKKR